jgi:hypothetical protein
MEEGIGKRKKSVISDTIYPIMPREPVRTFLSYETHYSSTY